MLVALIAVLLVSACKAQTNAEIEGATALIWAADANRLSDSDVTYNPDGPILFTYVNEAALNQGTYPLFMAMFDNYNPFPGTAEDSCSACDTERDAFLDAVIATGPMTQAKNFIVQYDSAMNDDQTWRDYLFDLWFRPYTRSDGPLDSSGFEHGFMGEIKDNAVSGFHNWVRAYTEEQNGNFVFGTSRGVPCDPDVPHMTHEWRGYNKNINSFWVKTSPEVEMAIYTVCFRFRPNQICNTTLGGASLGVQTYSYKNTPSIGSSYTLCTLTRNLTCYVCTSATQAGCSEYDFNSKGIGWQSGCAYCKKHVEVVNGTQVTTRECVTTCVEEDLEGSSTQCCSSGHYCNSATYIRSSFILLPLAMLACIHVSLKL